ncbi:glutamine amidotransferase [Paludisphaera rhizosphaerae]|uniref:glutamine amidotransferase n=1 Tax=Paludisphaera rhizosphaerae TaxID=2711216 RepID=UPI0013EBD500|nr:glutamine amidotransferase [Paludisphaera rhizosphaerae]
MDPGFSVSLNPIVPWPYLIIASAAVVALTIAAYARKLRGPGARWRWFAIGLRMFAVLLCLLAAVRPSVVLQEKKQQAASVIFLVDTSSSMKMKDEANNEARWASAKAALREGVAAAKKLGGDLEVKAFGFDSDLRELNLADDAPPLSDPEGRDTQIGTALLDVDKRQSQGGRRIARLVVLSDFGSNNGTNPLVAARRFRDQQTPISTVVFGTQSAGANSRDVAVRDITAGPTVFVKNKLEVRGGLSARGYGGQTVEVELFVDDQATAVAKTQVKVPDGAETIPITGLNYIPQTPGDKKVTLKVAPREGELVTTNNEISTFVSVLSGGLNVLFLQGPSFTWDFKYLMLSIATSPDIEVKGMVIPTPPVGDKGGIADEEFTPGRYDAYVLSDMAAEFLTPKQQAMLADSVKKGTGLIMLGGRHSFGPGGWGRTPVADVLPVEVHPGDGQIEPPDGVRFKPSAMGLNSYLLQIGSDPDNTRRLWEALPPLLGANRFGEPKKGAEILGTVNGVDSEPMLIAQDVGSGRSIAYAGDTWVWARTEAGRPAHRKFWRQIVFWLSHKENQGADQIKLSIDRRRVSLGQSVELTVTGRDAKGAPLTGVTYETRVEREGADSGTEAQAAEAVEVYTRGDESRGTYPARGKPGDYKVTVIGKRNGQEIGRDTARFLVFQEDRELENPAADPELARQIADLTAGEPIPPEQLAKHLGALDRSTFTEYVSATEHRVWDNWPFLLLFALCLTLEWWLRKRHGWV